MCNPELVWISRYLTALSRDATDECAIVKERNPKHKYVESEIKTNAFSLAAEPMSFKIDHPCLSNNGYFFKYLKVNLQPWNF